MCCKKILSGREKKVEKAEKVLIFLFPDLKKSISVLY